jgi:hypothetical protein
MAQSAQERRPPWMDGAEPKTAQAVFFFSPLQSSSTIAKEKSQAFFSKKFQKNKIEKNRKNQFSENSDKFAVPKIPKNNFQKISAILRFPVIFTEFSENYSSNGASP